MSRWHVAVNVLGRAGKPLTAKDIGLIDATMGDAGQALRDAALRELVTHDFRMQGLTARGRLKVKWYLTPLGQALFENRIHWQVRPFTTGGPNTGRLKGTAAVPMPTWLSSLPPMNSIRLLDRFGSTEATQ